MRAASGIGGFDELLDYWFGDTDEAATEAIDAHLFGCDACGMQLDRIAALAQGVRAAFAAGSLGVVVSPRFVDRLAERGLRVREYRVPLNGSVNCRVAREDDVLVSRLQYAGPRTARTPAVGRRCRRARDRPLHLPACAAGMIIYSRLAGSGLRRSSAARQWRRR